MNRTDFYNLQTDIAIETALTTLTNENLRAGAGEGAANSLNRKEALRYLVRRVMLKDRDNKVRRVAANTPGLPQS